MRLTRPAVDNPRQLAVVALLAVPTLALAVAALRSGRAPAQAEAVVAPVGSITVSSGQRWTWSGPSTCRPGTGGSVLQKTGSGGMQRLDLPLSTVTGLAAGPSGPLVAVGRDPACSPEVVTSRDGGTSWSTTRAAAAEAVDVDPSGQVWLVPRGGKGTSLQRLAPQGGSTEVKVGCPEGTGLTQVSAPSAQHVWALCEDDADTRRTLARSDDGGASWEWIANETSGTGLDGPGRARDLSFSDHEGYLLSAGRSCPEGELRTTVDAGRTWTNLPCPSATTPLGSALGIDFLEGGRGVLLGLRGASPVVAVTSRAGKAWRQVEPVPRASRPGQ